MTREKIAADVYQCVSSQWKIAVYSAGEIFRNRLGRCNAVVVYATSEQVGAPRLKLDCTHVTQRQKFTAPCG